MKKENNIEQNFQKLEEILEDMQDPQVSLDKSFELYNLGLKLVKDCNTHIDTIEKEIKIINEDNIDNE